MSRTFPTILLFTSALSFLCAPHLAQAEEERGGAFLVAGKVGGIAPITRLTPHAIGAVELGYFFGSSRALFAHLETSYAVPQVSGTDPDPRVPGESYDWELWQKQLVFQPTIGYRFNQLFWKVTPYAGIGPRLYLLETVTEGAADGQDFGTTKETSTMVGFGIPVGAELELGPGGVFAELQFQWAPLDHRITGDSNLGSGNLFLGYRAQF